MESNPFQAAVDLCNFSLAAHGKHPYIINVEEGTIKRYGNYLGTHKNPAGYRKTKILGKNWYLHRFIYSYAYGEIPDGMQVDHINHNGTDNRISNLRLVTTSENNKSRRKYEYKNRELAQKEYIENLNKNKV